MVDAFLTGSGSFVSVVADVPETDATQRHCRINVTLLLRVCVVSCVAQGR